MAWIAVEFWGKGDPFFGGSADDRPLGKAGEFLRGCVWSAVAEFETREAAEAAAAQATNRREGGKIGVFERAPAR